MLILLPVHVVAFVVLYLGTVHTVQTEILRTHSHDAQMMLAEAVRDLHPSMCATDRSQIPAQVGEFVRSHRLLDLGIYRATGEPMGTVADPEPAVRSFLETDDSDRFEIDREGNTTSLRGLLRLRSEGSCNECHSPGEVLGAATMRLDLTPHVEEAHSRVEKTLGFLIVGWGLVVGVLNIGLTTVARRSLSRMEAGGNAEVDVPEVILDPVSSALYGRLRGVIDSQREREREVTSRLHHTERLASLGQLAAGLAHEIKNPLAGIRGVIELLRDEIDDLDQRDLYEQMVSELDRVNITIHSLLRFARPAPPQRTDTRIRTLLEESVGLLQAGFAKRRIELEVQVADGTGTFSLDPGQIRQVLVNLVSNAADAIGEGGRIVVSAAPFPCGDGLILGVEDDGPGVPEDDQERIFEPFYTSKFSGTGLGLSVVRSLVDQHGGTVELRSEAGHGSTFLVLLPRPKTDDPERSGNERES